MEQAYSTRLGSDGAVGRRPYGARPHGGACAQGKPFRVFHDEVGLPPHAYLTQVRVNRARRLLSQGWPITEVAFEVGFVDQSHLNKRFKRITGMTPGQYRKNVQDR